MISFTPHLLKYLEVDNRIESKIIVSHILTGSVSHRLDVIKKGDIVTKINSQPIRTIDDLRREMKKNLNRETWCQNKSRKKKFSGKMGGEHSRKKNISKIKMKNNKTDLYLSIETESDIKKKNIFNLNETLADEKFLSQQYNYPLSLTTKYYYQRYPNLKKF